MNKHYFNINCIKLYDSITYEVSLALKFLLINNQTYLEETQESTKLRVTSLIKHMVMVFCCFLFFLDLYLIFSQ